MDSIGVRRSDLAAQCRREAGATIVAAVYDRRVSAFGSAGFVPQRANRDKKRDGFSKIRVIAVSNVVIRRHMCTNVAFCLGKIVIFLFVFIYIPASFDNN